MTELTEFLWEERQESILDGINKIYMIGETDFRQEEHEGHEKTKDEFLKNVLLENRVNLVNPVQKIPFISPYVPHV